MRVKSPRWLLLLEGLLLAVALLVLAYKAAMWVQPLPAKAVEQARTSQKRPDAATQLLEYYRQYPDRYIRVSDEVWSYDPGIRVAVHSFTLRNIATLPYAAIEVRFSYESANGKELLARTVKIAGLLAPFTTMSVKKIKITGVPDTSKSVTITVAKAVVVR